MIIRAPKLIGADLLSRDVKTIAPQNTSSRAVMAPLPIEGKRMLKHHRLARPPCAEKKIAAPAGTGNGDEFTKTVALTSYQSTSPVAIGHIAASVVADVAVRRAAFLKRRGVPPCLLPLLVDLAFATAEVR